MILLIKTYCLVAFSLPSPSQFLLPTMTAELLGRVVSRWFRYSWLCISLNFVLSKRHWISQTFYPANFADDLANSPRTRKNKSIRVIYQSCHVLPFKPVTLSRLKMWTSQRLTIANILKLVRGLVTLLCGLGVFEPFWIASFLSFEGLWFILGFGFDQKKCLHCNV